MIIRLLTYLRLSIYKTNVFNVAAADVKTHSNRYLLIATSGGLNQQRTGVSFLIELELHSNPIKSHLSFLPFKANLLV